MPEAKTGDSEDEDSDEPGRYKKKEKSIQMFGQQKKFNHKIHKQKRYHSSNGAVKSKTWIMAKKERANKQGKDVKRDSKFSGRKRSAAF